MISQCIVWNLCANAIEESASVRDVLARFEKPLQIYVGKDIAAPLEQADCPVIAIAPLDAPLDMGYFATSRNVAVIVRFALFDDVITDDGVRKTFRGSVSIDQLSAAIVLAIQGIDGLGDELTKAEVFLETENAPLYAGRIECNFDCKRGLAFEPEASEV